MQRNPLRTTSLSYWSPSRTVFHSRQLLLLQRLGRELLEKEKERPGADWPAHFRICSKEEADAEVKALLEKEVEARGEEDTRGEPEEDA